MLDHLPNKMNRSMAADIKQISDAATRRALTVAIRELRALAGDEDPAGMFISVGQAIDVLAQLREED